MERVLLEGEVNERIGEFKQVVAIKYNVSLESKYGRKFCKLTYLGRGSVWAFIDLSNGDILKAASWAKPAPHARGNIFADDYGMSGVNEYGPNYLR